jgi:DNA-binding NarL/FixJ family response regulator
MIGDTIMDVSVWGSESSIAATFVAWGLRPCEQAVMLLSLAGMREKDIAFFLYIELGTVREHRRSAYRKAGVQSRPGVVEVLTFANRMLADIRTRRGANESTI